MRRLPSKLPALDADPIPWIGYLVGVGSVLTCLLFAADAWLPKAEPRPFRDVDRTVMRVQAPVQQAGWSPSSWRAAGPQQVSDRQ